MTTVGDRFVGKRTVPQYQFIKAWCDRRRTTEILTTKRTPYLVSCGSGFIYKTLGKPQYSCFEVHCYCSAQRKSAG